jgi:hypothetical protein
MASKHETFFRHASFAVVGHSGRKGFPTRDSGRREADTGRHDNRDLLGPRAPFRAD